MVFQKYFNCRMQEYASRCPDQCLRMPVRELTSNLDRNLVTAKYIQHTGCHLLVYSSIINVIRKKLLHFEMLTLREAFLVFYFIDTETKIMVNIIRTDCKFIVN